MDDGLKQRLVGAIVIVAAAIIFLPMIFNDTQRPPEDILVEIPERPKVPKLDITKPVPPSEQRKVEKQAALAKAKPAIDKTDTSTNNVPVSWTLQLASFKERDNADALRDRLRKAGYKAYVRYRADQKPAMARVFIGPELNRQAIDKLKTRLEKELKLEGIVVRFNP